MNRQIVILILWILVGSAVSDAQQVAKTGREIPSGFCISLMEYKLYKMINDYRASYDLPAIPVSRSLSFVAETHVKDLYFNHPDAEPCNFHSWSDKGTWKPFCYPRDENKKNSVWDKPKELTNYKGKGYEIVYWENNAVIIDSIIAFWKSIPYFNSFLTNTGRWQGKKWNAIGIGIYENYACAWFGELADTEEPPFVCGQHPESQKPADKVIPPPSPGSQKPEPTPLQVSKPSGGTFYIIVKSQHPMGEMKSALEDLKSQGYRDAKILEKEDKVRLSIMEFKVKASADSALREIRKNYKDAWILKY